MMFTASLPMGINEHIDLQSEASSRTYTLPCARAAGQLTIPIPCTVSSIVSMQSLPQGLSTVADDNPNIGISYKFCSAECYLKHRSDMLLDYTAIEVDFKSDDAAFQYESDVLTATSFPFAKLRNCGI